MAVPDNDILQLLDNICLKNDKCYILNKEAYKRGLYNDLIPTFITNCIQYYHISKRKYLERKLTYNSFTTILRQICKLNKFTYTSQIRYDKSSYNIVYYIFFKN